MKRRVADHTATDGRTDTATDGRTPKGNHVTFLNLYIDVVAVIVRIDHCISIPQYGVSVVFNHPHVVQYTIDQLRSRSTSFLKLLGVAIGLSSTPYDLF